MHTPLRLGIVKYLNTLPLVAGLSACRDVELVPAAPSHLAEMLWNGGVDVALPSIVDAARSRVPLTMLPVGGIGCDGATLTVRVFSRVPMDRVTTLHADTDSHTSVLLARLLLRRCFDRDARVVDFDARERVSLGVTSDEEWPETLLLIGDKVVTDSPPAVRYPHQMDLGAQWKTWTGLPFVYAAWMCRSAEADDERILNAAALLERQRRRNATRLDWVVGRAVESMRWPADLARRYVKENLVYTIGPRQREAVSRFFAECAALDLLPAYTPRWHAFDTRPVPA